jgi:hypothetical protein
VGASRSMAKWTGGGGRGPPRPRRKGGEPQRRSLSWWGACAPPCPRFAGVEPVGGLAADGLRPRSGGVGLLRTGDEDGLWGFHPHAPTEGAWGAQAPH